jgi:hypothetical protein
MSRLFFFYTVLVITLASCKKDNFSKAIIKLSPVAKAGSDTTIMLPTNNIKLSGNASYDPDGKINSYQWRKIKGPQPGSINNPQNSEATAINLVQGIYDFELYITDNNGLTATDTMEVRVEGIAPDQTSRLFTQLEWEGDCFIKVQNINSFIPANGNFRVYLRSTFLNITSGWSLVNNSSGDLSYEIVNGELRVRAKNLDCNWDTSIYDILIDWD